MFKGLQNLEQFFKVISYAVALCGLFSLFVSGGVGILIVLLFLLVTILAWNLESTRWQISERLGIGLIFLILPLFYLDWKYQISGFGTKEILEISGLGRLILFLCAVKLLQKKSDRDWIFVYLISFFVVLLAAGLSISPLYLLSLVIYLLVTVCAIVAFEIRKTSRDIKIQSEGNLKVANSTSISPTKIPANAIVLLFVIAAFAFPLFFAFPRVGGAGFGGNQNQAAKITGFSDSVKLGEIGKLLQNDQIVMRVRLENEENLTNPRWRGIALDYFNNRGWTKSKQLADIPFEKIEKGYFIVNQTERANKMVVQTVYLEPIQTPVLFTLSRPIAVEGNFQRITKDAENSLNVKISGTERVSYKVHSDTFLPSLNTLKNDNQPYTLQSSRYLQLPDDLDEKIEDLTAKVTAGKKNRYDRAKAVESYLQDNFGYTLDLKATGEQPLSDFLFNVREGHCEYFATAMAVMLRTQGIATRVVNGFQSGSYNETADVYVVKQKDAHSWVEVYFPEENAWVPFDPTPFAGRTEGMAGAAGVLGTFNKYIEALETFWIQYFVAYDNQEQRSLFNSMKSGVQDYQRKTSSWLNDFQEKLSDWWTDVRGDKGIEASARAIGYGVTYLLGAILGMILLVWLYRKVIRLTIWQKLHFWLKNKNETSIVEFYERMQRVLAIKGFTRLAHQTPLEFAFALNMPEAVRITEKYNRVRFGEKNLSNDEAKEIENWLIDLESRDNEDGNL